MRLLLQLPLLLRQFAGEISIVFVRIILNRSD